MRFLRRSESATDSSNTGLEKGVYPSALRITAPLFPSVATIVTVITYLVGNEIAQITGVTSASWKATSGDFAVLIGLLAGILIWFTVAALYYPYTAAYYVSRRNYNGLREKLDYLKIRVEEADASILQRSSGTSVIEPMRRQALARAKRECEVIEKKLKDRGMPWVTGLGYIELWPRVHRAEEALIKVEPYPEVLEGAMRDQSRLENAHMENKEPLLAHLKSAISSLEDPDTDGDAQEKAESHWKTLTKLSEVRYEINNFRDNTWEGLIHLRNSLADTVVLLGLATYVLLALAIFLEPPREVIIWAVTYFLIGAIAGLFARAQAEWGATSGVDDFGLSKTKLLQIPWLSGLAATGGVLVTSILDPKSNTIDLTMVFSNRPVLIFVAAVFGVTPNLLIQRLDEQAEKTKEDLQSTQSSQSTEDVPSSRSGRRRVTSARARR